MPQAGSPSACLLVSEGPAACSSAPVCPGNQRKYIPSAGVKISDFFFPQSILFLNLGFLTNSDRLPYQSEVFLYFLMAFFFSFLFRFVPVCFLATLKAKGRDFVFDMSVLSGAPKQWMLTALMCLQPSPSTSSLSSTHSASPNVTSSAPSSARGQCQGVGLTEGVPGAVAPAP